MIRTSALWSFSRYKICERWPRAAYMASFIKMSSVSSETQREFGSDEITDENDIYLRQYLNMVYLIVARLTVVRSPPRFPDLILWDLSTSPFPLSAISKYVSKRPHQKCIIRSYVPYRLDLCCHSLESILSQVTPECPPSVWLVVRESRRGCVWDYGLFLLMTCVRINFFSCLWETSSLTIHSWFVFHVRDLCVKISAIGLDATEEMIWCESNRRFRMLTNWCKSSMWPADKYGC